ncbi:MAG: hypothetical protein R2854_18890 [Caldilineaceae bacterium]
MTDHQDSPHTDIDPQAEIEALKRQLAEAQARLALQGVRNVDIGGDADEVQIATGDANRLVWPTNTWSASTPLRQHRSHRCRHAAVSGAFASAVPRCRWRR